MWNFFQQHGKEFWRGAATVGVPVGSFLFIKQDLLTGIWAEFFIKLLLTIASAAASGFVYTLFSDYYKTKWKPRLFKNKKDKDNGSGEEKAA